MSKKDSVPASTRSPFRPKRRPPLNRSASTMSAKEEIIDFLVKQSNFHTSRNNEQKSYKEDHSNLDTDNSNAAEESKENSNDGHDSDDNSSSENVQEKLVETDEEEVTNMSPNKRCVTTSSITDGREKRLQKQNEKTQSNQRFNKVFQIPYVTSTCGVVFGILVMLFCFMGFLNSDQSEVKTESIIDISTIKEEFPTQDDDFWTSFEAGVQDVVRFNRPSTFIFLYNKESENTLHNLIKPLANYAVCKIKDCSKKPITITDAELNSPEFIEDYGRVIDRYKNTLEENGVMIIKHIENVRGISAQAFHSFCDEFSPLVAKSLFIFTMKIDTLENQSEMKFVEEYFRHKWTEINVDTFNALITRITSMVLEIKP